MEWKDVRAHFIAEFERLGFRQDDVAERGHVGQGRVSRILSDPTYSPKIETLLGAIEGLGLTPSRFFQQIERQTDADATAPTQSAITPRTEHGRPTRTVPAAAIDRDRVAEEALEDITLRLIDALTELSAARRQAAGTSPSRTGRVSSDRKSRR